VDEVTVAILTMAVVVFGGSAGSKLRGSRHYREFSEGLRQAALVPDRMLPVTAALLSGSEALTGVALTVALVFRAGATPDAAWLAAGALALATTLVAVLSAGVALVMRRGVTAHCVCFGSTTSSRPLGTAQLVRNIFLGVVLLAGLASAGLYRGSTPPVSFFVALAGGFSAGLVLTRSDDLVDLFRPVRKARPRDAG
jgi:Methylamine utilisation protein MauE